VVADIILRYIYALCLWYRQVSQFARTQEQSKKKKKRERETERQRACSSPSDDRWSGAKTFRARVRSSRVRWSRAKKAGPGVSR
jgi:Ni/Co efflux regulator RcnB